MLKLSPPPPPSLIPHPTTGKFHVKNVTPTEEGEAAKVKVKVRINIHGIFFVKTATMIEKQKVEEETMEAEPTPPSQNESQGEGEMRGGGGGGGEELMLVQEHKYAVYWSHTQTALAEEQSGHETSWQEWTVESGLISRLSPCTEKKMRGEPGKFYNVIQDTPGHTLGGGPR